MYKVTFQMYEHSHCSLGILMDDLTLHVNKCCPDSDDFVHFVHQVDGTGLVDDFEHLESSDNSLNMYIRTLAILLVLVTSSSDSWSPF